VVVTDAQGLLAALELGPWSQSSSCERMIWAKLIQKTKEGWNITFLFVFGHVGVAPNEAADRAAESARKRAKEEGAASAWIVDTVRCRVPVESVATFQASGHFRARHVLDGAPTSKFVWDAARCADKRSGERMLVRARCAALYGIDPPQADKVELCPACGTEGLSTPHLFTCERIRRDIAADSLATTTQLFSKRTDDIVIATKYVVAACSIVARCRASPPTQAHRVASSCARDVQSP
jgi:hypothetical protein